MTCAAVGAGITLTDGGAATTRIDIARQASATISAEHERTVQLSRDAARQAVPEVNGRRWTTAELDLRLKPDEDAKTAGELKSLRKIGITGKNRNGFTQVVVGKKTYWVTDDYLAKKKPTDPAHLPIAGKPCAGTSGVESGLTRDAIRVYRAVCNNFPQITRYGGRDGHGEHSTGRAIDIMTSDVATGNAVAEFLKANAAELNLFDVIWHQRIFTQQRGGEGWRSMPSRGSATANHMDHIHVSVY
ncbi:hypothetical protein [Marmoricola sp. OAE513]|uniref:hypothetical protein n=1 Tax=Marmoricola sp. OAE513 TaxID=2817894 RepID=UPI001AE95611